MAIAIRMYSDTAEGALKLLRDLSTLNLTNATAKPDPSVEGVWQVTLQTGLRSVVYMGGYRDPFGKVRQHDDFEVEDPSCKN